MFKLRPYRSLLVAVFFVAVIGGLISVYFFTDEAYLAGSHRGYFALSVTLILTLFLIVAAFSRYCFPHLRHHRHGYKRG